MDFNSPDITTFKQNLDSCIDAVQKHKLESHSAIKIQSLLNVIVYVMATRFLEASVKHILYNCCVMRGDTQPALESTVIALKNFNNPEFVNIKELFTHHLNFNIISGKTKSIYQERDITFLNEIVNNRHRNVHASNDSNDWYNQNKKDLTNFQQEYIGLLNILKYLDSIIYDDKTNSFKD